MTVFPRRIQYASYMQMIPFHKYQGAGNDFVMIDQRQQSFVDLHDEALISRLCDRRFGIGADGLILLTNSPGYDFRMIYFNADGREGSMCGNGGRCTVAFAHHLGLIGATCRFLAVDGEHEARVRDPEWIELKMGTVRQVEKNADHYFLDTGSPHYVTFVEQLEGLDVVGQGRAIRYSERFRAAGTNVNFVEIIPGGIAVATYERGVEDETLSCGTGVTAAAIAYYLEDPGPERQQVDIRARGGELQVRFEPQDNGFADIWLCGPAKKVFEGAFGKASL